MGITGVAVAGAALGITTGDGVIGVWVGMMIVGVVVSVAAASGIGDAVDEAMLIGATGGAAGMILARVDRARMNSPSASAPESRASRTDPRACTT
jgi:hypothetical protein